MRDNDYLPPVAGQWVAWPMWSRVVAKLARVHRVLVLWLPGVQRLLANPTRCVHPGRRSERRGKRDITHISPTQQGRVICWWAPQSGWSREWEDGAAPPLCYPSSGFTLPWHKRDPPEPSGASPTALYDYQMCRNWSLVYLSQVNYLASSE